MPVAAESFALAHEHVTETAVIQHVNARKLRVWRSRLQLQGGADVA